MVNLFGMHIIPPLPVTAGTHFTYPGGRRMEGWVNPQPGWVRSQWVLNPGPLTWRSAALPTELSRLMYVSLYVTKNTNLLHISATDRERLQMTRTSSTLSYKKDSAWLAPQNTITEDPIFFLRGEKPLKSSVLFLKFHDNSIRNHVSACKGNICSTLRV